MRLRTAFVVGAIATAVALPATAATAAAGSGPPPPRSVLAEARPSAAPPPEAVPPEAPRGGPPADRPPDAAVAADARQPRCGTPSVKDFPIATRIHGGPPVHHPGGGFEYWFVELTNTTAAPCRNIHPVIVLAARDRGLTRDRLMLEFYDPAVSRWLPADLETSGEDEVVAVLDESGAGGFTVPARAAVTVRVRLALTADTPPNQVTVNAAIVQRRGDDGDWLGESGDYRFAVLDDNGYGATVTRDELATTGPGSLLRLGAALAVVLLGGGAFALVARRLRALGR